MGLPFFVTPVEPDEVAKTVDKDAAQSRSTIRRRGAVRRPHPEPRIRDARQTFSRHASHLSMDLGMDLTELLPSPSSNLPHPEASDPRLAGHRRTREAARALRQDMLSFSNELDRPRDTPSMGPAAVRPTRAQVYRSGPRIGPLQRWMERRRGSESQHNPPLTLGRRETSTDLANNGPGSSLPALTANFSPARPYALQEPLDRPRPHSPPDYQFQLYHIPEFELTTSFIPRDQPSRDPNSHRELPPLQRMGRRVPESRSRRARVRAARVDGLGDRERSLSSDGDVVWETMLTTLTPDPQLPSAGSSFTSTSAVTSASSHVESSGTSITTMSSNRSPTEAVNPALDPICDLVEDSQDSSDLEDADGEDEEDLYELQDGGGVRSDFWRSYADVAAPRADRIARYQGRTELDTLGGMQRIVRRLARREDIPDEWWAEAGLSRNFPRDDLR